MTSKNQAVDNTKVEELTPQQKAAQTRARKKAEKEAAEQQALDLQHKEEFAKKEAKEEEQAHMSKLDQQEESTGEVKPEDKPQEPTSEKDTRTEWHLNDISSPSHERFSLKQGSKRMVELSPAEIKELGLAFDPEKFATRNNYIEVTKYKLVQLIKEGKFDTPKAIAKWSAPDNKFPLVEPIAPAPKKDKPSQTSNDKDLQALNFLDEQQPVNF